MSGFLYSNWSTSVYWYNLTVSCFFVMIGRSVVATCHLVNLLLLSHDKSAVAVSQLASVLLCHSLLINKALGQALQEVFASFKSFYYEVIYISS